jgi:hypothetical protein
MPQKLSVSISLTIYFSGQSRQLLPLWDSLCWFLYLLPLKGGRRITSALLKNHTERLHRSSHRPGRLVELLEIQGAVIAALFCFYSRLIYNWIEWRGLCDMAARGGS